MNNKTKIDIKSFAAIIFVMVVVLLFSLSMVARNVARRTTPTAATLNAYPNVFPSNSQHPLQSSTLYASIQGKRKDKPKSYDQDNDDILDYDDLCPDLYGPTTTKGCPDSDGDGVADFEDDCPTVAGLVLYRGCPDTDGDSIPDNKDVCPREKGPASNSGCPIVPQTGDPIAMVVPDPEDEEGKIIEVLTPESQIDYSSQGNVFHTDDAVYFTEYKVFDQPINDPPHPRRDVVKTNTPPSTTASVQQLPIVDTLTKNKPKSLLASPFVKLINTKRSLSEIDLQSLRRILSKVTFEQGRIIMGKDTRDALDEFADLLKKNQDWHVVVHCYAAEADNSYRNLVLSQNRGEAIKSHLIKKQIPASRIERKGYGNQFAVSDTTCLSHIDLEIN